MQQLQTKGHTVTRDFEVAAFRRVNIGYAFAAEIRRTDQFSVRITADDDLMEHVSVINHEGELCIGVDAPFWRLVQSPRNTKLIAEVGLPLLEAVTASGASHVTFHGFRSAGPFVLTVSGASHVDFHDCHSPESLSANVSGASTLKGEVEAGSLKLEVSGACHVTIKGAAPEVSINASGASSLSLGECPVDVAQVHLSGASSATLDARSKLGYDLSGASHLRYRGNPTVDRKHLSGASSALSG